MTQENPQEETVKQETENKRKKTKSFQKEPLIIIGIAVVIVIGVLVVFWFKSHPKTVPGETGTNQSEKITKTLEEQMQEEADKSNFSFRMEGSPEFETGDAYGIVVLENVATNTNNCKVVIKLNDSGKKLYESEVMKPGDIINKIKLDKNLKKGTYPATAYVTLFDDKEEEAGNGLAFDMSITVLK